MSEGKSFQIGLHAPAASDRKGTTSNSRKSDGRNRQIIGGKGPKAVLRQDVCTRAGNGSES